ncbi:branched-chain amino acid ABC transporter ATP-binding protein/permease [Pseudazoarcus pumilus]|uniref:ABC transporter n=1 Tax=Pseudazoarcus pumilus TaxID=2067960 RepID=A0A2I6S2V1_9RHOO|nr:branched-chain amino acid ABC transporter ATP-binding protein/permease [Pseudazoarcus pumilus]AUN93589.1 ABC transporter [Pseudazoarcus pumilus]
MKNAIKNNPFLVMAALFGLVLILAPWLVANSFQLRVVMLFMIYALVAMGLNILVGLAGLVSLGQAGIYALGAYAVAVLATSYGWGFFPAMLAAIVLTAIFGIALAYPTVRVRGVYLAVVTIAFGMIVQNVAIDWRTVTGGTLGISNVPRIDFGFGELGTDGLYVMIAIVVFLAFLVHHNVMYSRFGRSMRAVSQSEVAARALGIDPTARRVFAFVISAVYAGVAGGLYAYLNRYVNPDTFSFSDSIRFLLMVILGGSGTTLGPIVGAGVLTWIPNVLQAFGKWQLFAYGALLAVVIFFLPRGIVGTVTHWIDVARNRSNTRARTPQAWPRPSDEANALLRVEGKHHHGAVLATSGLTIRFGGLAAVSEVDVSIERATVHAIIGPNGAGKTTLLNALSGFYKPTEGEVLLRGHPIGGTRSDRIARDGLTRTFQNTELFADMTLEENVLVAFDSRYRGGIATAMARLPGHFGEERLMRARARMLLDYVGLADYADEIARNLAFGHQRRLEIARALALSPEVLLLDEPAAGLTHAEIDDLIALIRDLKALGITIVLVEHHVDMIMAVSDHVTVLDYGQVIASGTPDQVQDDPRVVEAYFGTAAVNPNEQGAQ